MASPFLQILFDDSGDDADGDAAFLIQTGNGKADVVFFSGHSPVIAGVGNRVDTVVEPDEHNAVPHIGHSAGVFALQDTFIQIALVGGGRNAADICCDGNMVDVIAVNGEHTDKNTVADAVILAGVTEPCGRQIAGENRTLHAEHFHTQDFFRNANDARLYDASFINHGDAIFVGVQIEGLTLTEHSGLAACHNAAGGVIQTPDDEIDLRGEHGRKDTVHPLHKRLVFRPIRNGSGIEHHFFQRDRNAITLVVNDNDTQIERMADAGVLYQVISDFTADNADMNPEKISAIDMGYVFENLVQRFSESYDEEAGAHFTSRDIIYLMCDLLTMNADFSGEDAPAKTVYDMAMGTSQMLTCMEERIHAFDKEAEIICYGQEINPFTFGIAKADMLIRGGDPENMQFGDTLNADKFKGYTFDYIISNPPFGIDWKREAADVEKEHKLGDAGRFGVGLPQKSDGQMLFLLNGIAKLKDTGRMAIIQNGSSLFTGDAGSGPSEIRRYIIENDWLDAIVQLPNDSFYNTGIATYIWIVSKNKPETHRERILLIDASKCCEARRRPIGNKRVDITESCRNLITQAYSEYRSAIFTKTLEDKKTVLTCKSKVLDAISLGYNKITVESPALDDDGNPIVKKGKPVADTSKRDTESVPLDEDVDAYFAREVLPYRPGAWIDKSKTKVGYEIPFTRTFYEYEELEPAADIAERIAAREKVLMEKLQALFGNGGGQNE